VLLTLNGRRAAISGQRPDSENAAFPNLKSPAGALPDTLHVAVDGLDGAVIPNGRFITPAGVEVNVNAPKPFGMALSPDGKTLATINSGTRPFSITLVHNLSTAPAPTLIKVNATFMGIVFSSDSQRFYASGGENGNIWVGDPAAGKIIGSVNLNGPAHPLPALLDVTTDPPGRFEGVFAGALTFDGRYLYVVDQAGFQVHVVDTTKIITGVDAANHVIEPNNFAALAGQVKVGRYPFGITLSPNHKALLVTHVGIFQYKSLLPASATGDSNIDFPLAYPGAGYPDETESDRTIAIKKVDPRNLPDTLSIPDGIRVGYIAADRKFTVPGLGSPNVPEASSVYFLDVSNPAAPTVKTIAKTGPLVGEVEHGIQAYTRSHPNSAVWGPSPLPIFVANGNNDSVSLLDPTTYAELRRIDLDVFAGIGSRIKGVQPVALALSPDAHKLYVAEAGINAVGIIDLTGHSAELKGQIPVGWWPSSLQVSPDGKTLYVANADGRGALPNETSPPNNLGSPKSSTLGTVNIIPIPDDRQLENYTERVLANNGFIRGDDSESDSDDPIPTRFGVPSDNIKHVIFINKENSTYDQLLGDITATRKGVPVEGDPAFSLGAEASPNHHELALEFSFSDNFFLEPSVSSDGHNWLTDTYPTEFEQTHWPASYGGERNDSGDDPSIFIPYPGRLGFTDANSSPDPQGYDQHGGIFLHLARNQQSFVNFGNGYEFAIVDEDGGTEPTGIREHVNVPMEKVIRDNSDQMYPEFNTHIPDAPLPEDPTRFNRFGRFKQVFESHYVDRANSLCKLPSYVDLYFPNDHGGGALDINPSGPAWSYKRFVQDNDAALGLTAELVSHSPCWKDTVLFVVEDDPQNGHDHLDGTRSIFLAISPWVKRNYVSKVHYSLSSIFKTVNLIFGIPPLNQYDAAATDLRDIFTDKPDFTPYNFTPITYAKGANAIWLTMTKGIDFSGPDRDEVRLRAAIMKSEGLPRRIVRRTSGSSTSRKS